MWVTWMSYHNNVHAVWCLSETAIHDVNVNFILIITTYKKALYCYTTHLLILLLSWNVIRQKLKLSVFVVTLPTRSKKKPTPKILLHFIFRKLFLFSFLFFQDNIFGFSFAVYFFCQYCLSNDTIFPNAFWSQIKKTSCPWQNIHVGTQNILIVGLGIILN